MKKIYISDMTFSVFVNSNSNELTFREKLDIAKALERTGVDAIELPMLSEKKEDFVVYKTISSSIENCTVCIPGGNNEDSILNAYECIKDSQDPCIQIVLPISTIQMEYIYHLKEAKMIDMISDLCKTASKICNKVEFVALDATRAEPGFAEKCCMAAFENGAYAVTLCDDNGDYFPVEFAELVKNVKGCCGAKVFIKPSDKLNMAAANAIYAIEAGADGVKTLSLNSEGLSLDAISDILRAKGEQINAQSQLDITAIHNIIANTYTNTLSKNYNTPESSTNEQISLGEASTLADIVSAVSLLGYELSDEDNGKVYEAFKRVSAKKGTIGTRELEAVIASSAMQVPSTFHVINYVVNSGNTISATASITLEKDGEQLCGVSMGDGPIDAAFHAIEQIVGHKYELDDFQVQAVTKGREAVGSSIIRLRDEGKLYSGNGVSTDIIGACIRAYINALNKIVYEEN